MKLRARLTALVT